MCVCVYVCVCYAGDAPPPYLRLFGMTSSVLQPPRVTIVAGPEENQRSVPNQYTRPPSQGRHHTAATNTNTSCGSLYYEAATKNKPRTGESRQLFVHCTVHVDQEMFALGNFHNLNVCVFYFLHPAKRQKFLMMHD